MKNNNDADDGVFDWNLLNGKSFVYVSVDDAKSIIGGKGWESVVSTFKVP